jgi:SAM-dependent methyltransferase
VALLEHNTLGFFMAIDYHHGANRHTLGGAFAALSKLLSDRKPRSLLDVGCGTGTWLKAAQGIGVPEVFGIDGVAVCEGDFLVPKKLFRLINLEHDWKLEQRFEVALCLEVAEHLSAETSPILVRSLVAHADMIFFSAACPGQEGEHHVNCQWPLYWQKLFNQEGFCCDDSPRWRLWEDERIEPWYRQNLLVAIRNTEGAGKEPRIHPVIHPAMFGGAMPNMANVRKEIVRQVSEGSENLGWYLGLQFRAIVRKLRRRKSH